MSAADRLAAAMNALAMATREQQEQRGLRERHVEEGKAAALETMKRDAAVHARYIERMQELNKRQQKSGGWLTEKALADRDHKMSFGPEDDEPAPADEFASYARPEPRHETAPPPPPIAPSVPGVPEPAHGAAPEPPPSAEPAPPAPRRTGRHARVESFDDDDFSNNSWLVD
ncbi:hypothetical protein [Amycolatopsis sp. cmx-4-61]|uniref:hypothetical protein n=1 Tax=Amycolatopsis sp. cmx-4-61 TaxID=2790937 RepID=UPI00397BD7DD